MKWAAKLAQKGDKVVSMAILSESNLAIEKREEFLKIPVEYRLNYRLTNDLTQITAVIEQKTENKDLLKPNEAQELALNEQFILSVTENGYGKRTSAYEYRVTGRGGQGVLNIDTSERNGNVIASFPIDDHDEIIVLSDKGTLIRLKVDSIRITGRNAMGVRIINLKEAEKVISITRVVSDKSDDIEGNDNDDNNDVVVEEAK